MNTITLKSFIKNNWENSIIPALKNYIRIPNKSPAYDSDWQKSGYMDKAMALLVSWCYKQSLRGMQLKVHQTADRTPLLLIDIAGQIDSTILLYGHMDKQPEMTGWDEGLGPWEPVLRDGKLYGRGGADDGYSTFAAITAIAALQQQNIPHSRCIILIEASEESGSSDLPYYIENLKNEIPTPDLIIALDSGCGNYEQFWCTTSLRGLVNGTLQINILTEGVHSGAASGVVPSSFRILRQLLDRIEDATTGRIIPDALYTAIPANRQQEAAAAAHSLKELVYKEFPFVAGAAPMGSDFTELLLNRSWRPALSVTGATGMPAISNAGNVLRPETAVMLSMRLPPTLDAKQAATTLKQILEKDPPYNAKVSFNAKEAGSGWEAPAMADWLGNTINQASQEFFAKPAAYWGEGGSIPFMGMLGKKFPQAQFVITGVLGPKSNAHGPNEFLHLGMAEKITGCIATIIAAQYQHKMGLK